MSDPNNDCCYAICSSCYIENAKNEKGNRRPKRKRQHPDKEPLLCNERGNHHQNELIMFTDSQYLNHEYLRNRIKDGDKVPIECACCQKELTNKAFISIEQEKELKK